MAAPTQQTDFMAQPLKAVLGARTANALAKLDLHTIGDLLGHYPRRYAQPGQPTQISGLQEGVHVSVVATVVKADVRTMRSRGGAMLQATVADDAGHSLSLTFFGKSSGQLRYHLDRLRLGSQGVFSGTVSQYRGQWQLTHPAYVMVGGPDEAGEAGSAEASAEDALYEATKPIPIYPASAAMPTWKIQRAVRTVLDTLPAAGIADPVPDDVRQRVQLPSRRDALLWVHHPDTQDQWRQGRHRLRFEEAFVLQAALAQRRLRAAASPATARPLRPHSGQAGQAQNVQAGQTADQQTPDQTADQLALGQQVPGQQTSGQESQAVPGLLERFDLRLPFSLTQGQVEVGQQIAADLSQSHPMQRLLQGEVGSGKTVVALRAMLQVVDAGGQAALLAPTEVLATQHARSLTAMLGGLAADGLLGGEPGATRVVLLTGSLPAAAKREALLAAASGQAGIVVGTHALLSENVQFADLGLVVVDEQHRFGVEQRDRLRAKGVTVPHLLVMTATPIPRTVAMTVFGDLETSLLTQVPAGRQGIRTVVVPAANQVWVDRMWARVAEEVAQGHRAYVVCPRITTTDPVLSTGQDTVTSGPVTAEPATADLATFDLARGAASADATLTATAQGGATSASTASAGSAWPADGSQAQPLHSVEEVADMLRSTQALAGLTIDTLHGSMAAAEKDAAMSRFAAGRSQILVATTVIEVGVDVPQATVMVVFNADRFGLSQLHQLRGRVGRGNAPGLCLLVSDAQAGSPAAARVEALAQHSDGFELAQIDLDLRSEGDVLGASQSGRASSLKLLRVLHDAPLIEQARSEASAVVEADPHLAAQPDLAAAISAELDAYKQDFLDRA